MQILNIFLSSVTRTNSQFLTLKFNHMASIETEVNKIISDIAGTVISGYSTTLSTLGFDAEKCSELADELDSFVEEKSPGSSVSVSDISPGMSVQDVIDLVSEKIG